jgi:hypothetical protein
MLARKRYCIFAFLRFFFYAELFRPLAEQNRRPPSSPGLAVQHATHVASVIGSIRPKTGCASIV